MGVAPGAWQNTRRMSGRVGHGGTPVVLETRTVGGRNAEGSDSSNEIDVLSVGEEHGE